MKIRQEQTKIHTALIAYYRIPDISRLILGNTYS